MKLNKKQIEQVRELFSEFEIELNNDMEYKTKDINIHIDNSYGYGLSEVYGEHLAS